MVMNRDDLSTAPRAVRLAVARALVDNVTGGGRECAAAGEGAAARAWEYGGGSRRERVDTGIDRIGMGAGRGLAGGAGHEKNPPQYKIAISAAAPIIAAPRS